MGEQGAYQIFRILRVREDEIYVTSRDSLNAAKAYVAKLMNVWPGEYVIRGPDSPKPVHRPPGN